jgi:hypothetical protein
MPAAPAMMSSGVLQNMACMIGVRALVNPGRR